MRFPFLPATSYAKTRLFRGEHIRVNGIAFSADRTRFAAIEQWCEDHEVCCQVTWQRGRRRPYLLLVEAGFEQQAVEGANHPRYAYLSAEAH